MREGISKSFNDNVLCSGKIDHSRHAKYCCICAQHSISREAVGSADNLHARIQRSIHVLEWCDGNRYS